MGVTIHDIAQFAGVSVSTASRALNSKDDVSDDARERVLAAARALNFTVNAHARALAGASSKTLGLIVVNSGEVFFAQLATGAADVATERGYSVIVCNTGELAENETKAHRMLREKRVDGVLIGSVTTGAAPLQRLVAEKTPFVLLNRYLDDFDADCVYSNNRQGAYDATTHLCQLGHRRIMHLTHRDDRFSARERLAGYRRGLVEHGIAFDPELVVRCILDLDCVYEATRRALATITPRPTAIFSYNDRICLAILRAISDAGLSVPADIALVGYDDLDLASFFNPPLTTVTHAAYQIGRLGAEMLLDRIDQGGGPGEARRVVLTPELRIRESTQVAVVV